MQRIRILQRIWAYTWFEPAAPEDAAAAALTATCQVKVSCYLHLSFVDIIHDNYSMYAWLLTVPPKDFTCFSNCLVCSESLKFSFSNSSIFWWKRERSNGRKHMDIFCTN